MTFKKSLIFGTALTALLIGAPLHAADNGQNARRGPIVVNPVSTPLSSLEENDLIFMREEEKMARDVYLTLYETWGLNVFANISRSEQKHMDRMGKLIAQYDLVDPVIDDSIGVFQDQDLAQLYAQLLDDGLESELKALYVGALIEEVDIMDLQRAIDDTDHPDVIDAYEDLMKGSRNHLRAFVQQIENQGLVYEAQVMPQDAVDAIIDTPIERGPTGIKRNWWSR